MAPFGGLRLRKFGGTAGIESFAGQRWATIGGRPPTHSREDLAASQPVEGLGVEDASHRSQCQGVVAVPEPSLSRGQSASDGSDAIDPVWRITGIV